MPVDVEDLGFFAVTLWDEGVVTMAGMFTVDAVWNRACYVDLTPPGGGTIQAEG